MIQGALVLPLVMIGMIDASATRSPPRPRTLSSASTTASDHCPSCRCRRDGASFRRPSSAIALAQRWNALVSRRELLSEKTLKSRLRHHVPQDCTPAGSSACRIPSRDNWRRSQADRPASRNAERIRPRLSGFTGPTRIVTPWLSSRTPAAKELWPVQVGGLLQRRHEVSLDVRRLEAAAAI